MQPDAVVAFLSSAMCECPGMCSRALTNTGREDCTLCYSAVWFAPSWSRSTISVTRTGMDWTGFKAAKLDFIQFWCRSNNIMQACTHDITLFIWSLHGFVHNAFGTKNKTTSKPTCIWSIPRITVTQTYMHFINHAHHSGTQLGPPSPTPPHTKTTLNNQ